MVHGQIAQIVNMMDEASLASGIYENFRKCLALRQSYIDKSLQNSSDDPKNHIRTHDAAVEYGQNLEKELPPKHHYYFSITEEGYYTIFESVEDFSAGNPLVTIPSLRDYYRDANFIASIINHGPSRTLAFRRLRYLEAQFGLHQMLNEHDEIEEQKKAPHRDFYNIRKVDTHIHHSAAMNCKHLLRFIKHKLKTSPDDRVIFRDGKELTLAEVFQSLNLTAYDLNIDKLDMHAHKDSFHRFDRFNLKYNPIGEARLREIFLKTDNFIKGKYLAELTQELFNDLEANKYVMAEYRLSIYGRSLDEWDKLASWVVDNNLFSYNVRWIIQIPRLFDVYIANGSLSCFEDLITNIFQPLFEVTKDPSSHPKLHLFLKRVVGFDSVDDESKVEKRMHKKFPFPRYWESKKNPPYSYYAYYIHANLTSLNHFRQARGFNLLSFRPHSGEAGDPEHLIYAFLTAKGINHGILLRKVPVLQYLFYIAQIGIAMSPLSNNALFLNFDRNPFPEYFKRGLNVSLSTDDPLQFHYTREPLIEEYSVAAQIWKLSSVDLSEIARNSVLQSDFAMAIKRQWIGDQCDTEGNNINDVAKTNVPNIRHAFRYSLLQSERALVQGALNKDELVRYTPENSTKCPNAVCSEAALLAQVEADIVGGVFDNASI